ncbi:MAG: O-methyltransferase [Bacteroidales bacterium]|nr:O-methyltransferase [Bacteroidales bacterium]
MTEQEYLEQFSTPQNPALKWLERQTHIRTNHARMLSGPVIGRLLSFFSKSVRPKAVLELGVFTGYSTICLAEGLDNDGHIDSLELNDELEDLIREGYRRAGIEDRVRLQFGDAKELIPTLEGPYDLVYIDANKREYPLYYELLFNKVRPGGLILADNVMWDDKVLQDPLPSDAQTRGIHQFNQLIASDDRVENFILPLRDGVNVIWKK